MRLRAVLEFVKIEHTLFALPFVLAGFVLGLLAVGEPLAPTPFAATKLALLLVGATAARTAAMTVNRIIDREIDARNPRTAGRHLPAGRLGVRFAWGLAVVSFAVMIVASGALNLLCLALSPVLVLLFLAYPYAKRWTWACHFVLGLAFLAAPVGGYLAVTGSFAGFWPSAWIGAAALAWVAGFDVIYALLDVEVDRAQGIRSIPARFGVPAARAAAATLHAATVLLLAVAGLLLPVAWPWWVGVGAVGALLAYEHAVVNPRDPEAVNRAFFAVNAVVGWVALAALVAALA